MGGTSNIPSRYPTIISAQANKKISVKVLVIDNNLAHAIEDLRRETEGIDLLPISPNFDEDKVNEIAKKILEIKS